MSEPINLGADLALRRLLEQPAPAPHQVRLLTATQAIRAGASLADTAQMIGIAVGLRRFFSAAAETFSLPQSIALAMLAAAIAVALRRAQRLSDRSDLEYTDALATQAAVAAFVAIVLLSAICWVTLSQSVTPNPQGRTTWFVSWAILSSFAAVGVRYGAAWLGERLECGSRVLIIGSPQQSEPVARMVQAAPRSRWRLAGSFDDTTAGALDAAVELISRRGADIVVLALAGPDAASRVSTVCERLADQPVRVSLALDTSTFTGLRRSAFRNDGIPLFDIAFDPHGGIRGLLKRYLDVSVSLLLIVLLAPLMALAAIAIKLDSPGPVLFRQLRFGLGSQPIRVLKFRTMRTEHRDATGGRWTRARDPRVTRVGRFLRRTSIDELPQLFNVLRGDMSLVGPRPHPLHMRVDDVYYFEAVSHYRARHAIRPGITGWAQVNGSRGAVDTLEKAKRRIELDLYYLEHWSLAIDLKIILRTATGGFLSVNAD